MPLSTVHRASRVKVPLSRLALAPQISQRLLLQCALAELYRMCVMVKVLRACAALVLSGRLLAVILLLDTVYFACVYETAVLPRRFDVDNVSNVANASVLPSSFLSSSSSSGDPDVSVSASLSSSSSSSSSSAVERKSQPLPGLSSSSHLRDVEPSSNVSVNNLTQREPDSASNVSHSSDKHEDKKDSDKSHQVSVERRVTSPQQGVTREFPLALVVASSVAAVSILVFFCLSYLWHTRQLDHRAQKLAIRLAAEAEADMNCAQCRSPATYMRGASQDSTSDSGAEDALHAQLQRHVDELNSLNEEEEEEDETEDAEGRRRKPGGVGRTLGSRRGRGRGSRRCGSRSSRKWSGNSSGPNRSSLVTDQEILSHFASRRHSTFFI